MDYKVNLPDNEYNKVLLILVLYNTKLSDSTTFKSLCKAHLYSELPRTDLFIYDNSLLPQDIRSDYADLWDVKYVHDPSNPGVSKAYNEGAKFGKSYSKEWILILDQDTTFPIETFNKISGVLTKPKDFELYVPILKSGDFFVSPSIYKFKRGFAPKSIIAGKHSLTKFSPVNSGILISLDSFFKVHGYNEKIRLDFSDFAFVDRLRNVIGDFMVLDIICKHDLSSFSLQTFSSAIYRYESYCEGAKISAENFKDKMTLFFVCLLRALRLTVRYKKIDFLMMFYTCYIKG